ncbi:MAG: phosphoribosylformylglycinamidine synthase subunit PurS [Bdellovibrionales bacterium]
MGQVYYVRILPKAEVLDVQGRAVYQMLKAHQFPIQKVRVGKLIEVELEENIKDAKSVFQHMIKEGLYNPLVETAEVEGL